MAVYASPPQMSFMLPPSSPIEPKITPFGAQPFYPLQVIQLDEVSPPPRMSSSSFAFPNSPASSYASSSSGSSFASSYDSESCDDEEDEDEDMEDAVSYCSSEGSWDESESGASTSYNSPETTKRIQAWRTLDTTCSQVSQLKERAQPRRNLTEDDDATSEEMWTEQYLSRSRSHPAPLVRSTLHPVAASSCGVLLRCCACDAAFGDEQALRCHGLDQHATEACRQALEYFMES